MGSQKITSYRDLIVWKRAMEPVEEVYKLTDAFPKKEEYRLTSQTIRAAISAPANIAEGFMRNTRKDYADFIGIARGSAAELDTLLMLAGRMRYASAESIGQVLGGAEEISRMLNSLRQKLSSSPKTENLKPKTS
ncbi:four helix bundle protein [Amphiplicatus metriothermophilus]|uniref:Four helix bundle protein n=1 Tax=Amphiplicatus metriothermophilus TaxID=1519374 RepID=A0A239PST2_9PROT|nr:four helix bundle protein [Amphiplicatus metriothermophilus]MBB5519256.1 four helix bundle protein [Amphiplicatus metriothermophilus]SNT73325.1 four helix bundle protein [Amphiplicatus metriothermophilus]